MTVSRSLLHVAAASLIAGGLFLSIPGRAPADEGKPSPEPGGEGKKDRPEWKRDDQRNGEGRRSWGGPSFESLSEAEKAELRSAMDAVWHDPGVLAAREAMQVAGEGYKAALRKSIENTNPKIREILTKMMEGHPGMGGWGGPKERRPGEGGESPIEASPTGDPKEPPFFKALSEEDRQILREARKKADEDEGVKAAVARKDAAQTMEEKIAALRDLRGALHKAMILADPRVSEVLSKLPVPGRDRGDGRKGDRGGHDEKGGNREGEERKDDAGKNP